MAFTLLKKHWAIILGVIAFIAFVTVSVLALGNAAVGKLVDAEMRSRGQNFADLLMAPDGNIDAFMTGIARDPDAETTMRRVADLANIDSFAIFDREGNELFRSRSDRYEWLLRDRPGGVTTGDRLSHSVISKPGHWQIVYDDGETNPSVITPLIRNGTKIGFVSVVADMIADRYHYQTTLARTSALVVLVLLCATGLPFLLYLMRKRKIAEADERIRFLADHDALTHLLNRRRMQEETDQILTKVRVTRERLAYLYIDLDDLAEINDSFGQACGDDLLRVVAGRLAASLGPGDLLARIGPDDFAILHRRVGPLEDVVALARRLTEAVGETVELKGQTVTPKISIGCAMVSEHGRTHSELVKHAEIAHFHHKGDRQEPLIFFEPRMDEEMHRRRQIEALLRKAIENDAFELFYQPLVKGEDGSVVGFEALLRLRDQDGEYVSPAEFVPIAESRGYIKTIGTWVIYEAARQISQWPEPLFVSVNLSAVQFVDGDLVDIIRDALAKAGIDGRRLEVEVVESLLLERSGTILDQLVALKKLGISIDMDDFGTGYSSLGYLWRFPFDKLKIDQSFMKAMINRERNVDQIIATIVSLAHHMKMKVTTEGVETEEQVEFLRSLGCDQLQGFYFGKPMPATEVAAEILSRFDPRARIPGRKVDRSDIRQRA
ncbi:putative bifunctional diguanylate cyclase/phosphodiesterase [Jiella marina]|uniref:putative bifunctional diguanylate cyclase/phosphodiesterase n=1 Tax=Jiella sp. LLJ827 TaxID=2917712 RepID=UPI0021019B99|nr:GGDEF and EAL domain-containing protein [Jiella sp. LLJ827]MCQ0988939.1 GGDEF and EAL domain-containing protein [Jiella sp. LLJ827]